MHTARQGGGETSSAEQGCRVMSSVEKEGNASLKSEVELSGVVTSGAEQGDGVTPMARL